MKPKTNPNQIFVDVARNKPAVQGSTHEDDESRFAASFAVDQDDMTCSFTKLKDGRWWRVDLRSKQWVKKVYLVFKQSSRAGKFKGEIRIGKPSEMV